MRPTIAEIDLSAVAFNFRQIKQKVAPAKIMAVVKANAYGHGVIPVARTLIKEGASFLAVATVDEGIELRQAGIQTPILVFGGLLPYQAGLYPEHDLQATIFSLQDVASLEKAAQQTGIRAKVHINVDTGMGRVGVPFESAVNFVLSVANNSRFDLVGIYTHLATSDEKDKTFANLQLERFNRLLVEIRSKGTTIPLIHAANSGAILDMPDSYFDMVRPGISLYGYYPGLETTESFSLRPAMTLKTRVFFIKKVEAGTSVSYGRRFFAKETTRVATLPIGYADGYNRLLTNQGFAQIRNRVYPVIGTVTMDQIMIDLGQDSEIKIGDEAVLFGPEHGEQVSVDYICQKINTIPYEVVCSITERVPRVYVNRYKTN